MRVFKKKNLSPNNMHKNNGILYKRIILALKIISIVCFISVFNWISAIIVDGSRKMNVTATARQLPQEQMISSFNTKTCGIADPWIMEKEFVNMARDGQFPWMVSFQVSAPDNATHQEQLIAAHETKDADKINLKNKTIIDLHFCGGALIDEKWVLSAAHCFASKSIKNYLKNGKIKIVGGSPSVSSKSYTNQVMKIKNIFYYSLYNPKKIKLGYDIALIELRDKVKFRTKRLSNLELPANGTDTKELIQVTPFLNAICLPKSNIRSYPVNSVARIAGWGFSEQNNDASMPSKLLTTDVLVRDINECKKQYINILKLDTSQQGESFHHDLVCAGFNSTRDTCQSDSGGPLMQYSGNKAVFVGIVSFGLGCATGGVPGLYTRVSYYSQWIESIIRNGTKATRWTLIDGFTGNLTSADYKHPGDIPLA